MAASDEAANGVSAASRPVPSGLIALIDLGYSEQDRRRGQHDHGWREQ